MRRHAKWPAFIALGVLVLPWTTAVALALHLAHDHETSQGDLTASLHGHTHAEGTPDHDHVLAPPSTPVAEHSRGLVVTALRAALNGTDGDRLAPVSLPRPAPDETASPPTSPPGRVLRI